MIPIKSFSLYYLPSYSIPFSTLFHFHLLIFQSLYHPSNNPSNPDCNTFTFTFSFLGTVHCLNLLLPQHTTPSVSVNKQLCYPPALG